MRNLLARPPIRFLRKNNPRCQIHRRLTTIMRDGLAKRAPMAQSRPGIAAPRFRRIACAAANSCDAVPHA